ncbi:hypothetical protein M2650_16285 [Luteimonas sp. SX5]|uniref:Lipoprotein n=1 Tax=Luteimonas galliterrae TaxID=2940486 RepID=A0ABT0MMR9_9GAMM|nr:hypothetical protein [Luteimonas galliterrae]MCL1636180.1 hypothetical protein [Luteimonas galliterrae]
MKRMTRTIAILALALPFLACAAETGTAARYAGAPYTGDVDVRVRTPDGALKRTDAGTGSAHFKRLSNGRIQLVVDGLINKETAGFVLEGNDSRSGWRAGHDNVVLDMSPGGAIRGGGTSTNQRLRFDGNVTDAHFGLDVELQVLTSKPGGPPPGTTYLFHYDLDRSAASDIRTASAGIAPSGKRVTSGNSASSKSKGKCKRTVWQTRNVASMSGAPMIMTQVPVCVEW